MDELQKRLLKQNADMIKQYQYEADKKHKAEKKKHDRLITLFKGGR